MTPRKVTGLSPRHAGRRPAATRCPKCGTPVIIALAGRRRVAVDAQLALVGTVVLWFEVDGLGAPVGDPPVQHVSPAPAEHIGPRWSVHDSTCPKASQFRRQQAERGEL